MTVCVLIFRVHIVYDTGKKSRFFKVFKVAGKKCITMVKQKKTVNEEMKMTMVDFNIKVLND